MTNTTLETSSGIPSLKIETIGVTKPLTPTQLVWRRFRKHRMALVGSIVITESAANNTDLIHRLQAPTSNHVFGTDSIGRDVFNRIIYGGQISLIIGVLAVVLENGLMEWRICPTFFGRIMGTNLIKFWPKHFQKIH